MGQYTNKANRLLTQAEAERRYCYGTNESQCRALLRLKQHGKLVSPYHNVYVRTDYFKTLNPIQKAQHLARTLTLIHPHWQFAGPSAAAMLGLNVPWSMLKLVYIATQHSIARHAEPHLRRIFIPRPKRWKASGVSVTEPARTLVDCALRFPFEQTLGVFDSALAKGLLLESQVESVCTSIRADTSPVSKLLRYANGLSSNGGESRCRALIIESGFAVPELQHKFIDPRDGRKYYTDFLWQRPDGRMIVLEYDGLEKYTNPEMAGNRSTWGVVNEERQRESALKRAGVSDIRRISSAEINEPDLLASRLEQAGVPKLS